MSASEKKQDTTRLTLIGVAAALVVVAAGIGLSLGNAAQPDSNASQPTIEKTAAAAQITTTEAVRRETAKQGFKDGLKSGLDQGGRAGRRAGESDGKVQAQLNVTEEAQSAAASAQAELDAISAPPPTPTAPTKHGRTPR